jgi:hypothetical protein
MQTMTAREFRRRQGAGKPRYRVAPKADRTVDGIVFASRGEALYYRKLKDERHWDGETWWVRQPVFDLAGTTYRPDYLVCRPAQVLGQDGLSLVTVNGAWRVSVVEVKPKLRDATPRQRRFRAEALRTFRRNARQLKEIWGIEVQLVEVES